MVLTFTGDVKDFVKNTMGSKQAKQAFALIVVNLAGNQQKADSGTYRHLTANRISFSKQLQIII